MNNQELFDAIAFAFQAAMRISYDGGRSELMMKHLKELLSIQLDRAKHESRNNLSR